MHQRGERERRDACARTGKETSEARRGALPSALFRRSRSVRTTPVGRKRPRISTDDCGLPLPPVTPSPPRTRPRVLPRLYRCPVCRARPWWSDGGGGGGETIIPKTRPRDRLNPVTPPNRICFESCHGPRASGKRNKKKKPTTHTQRVIRTRTFFFFFVGTHDLYSRDGCKEPTTNRIFRIISSVYSTLSALVTVKTSMCRNAIMSRIETVGIFPGNSHGRAQLNFRKQ